MTTVEENRTFPAARRASLLLLFAALHGLGANKPKLGDPEWMRKYRLFIKASNDFVIAINDDVFDRVKWERLKAAWREIDVE